MTAFPKLGQEVVFLGDAIGDHGNSFRRRTVLPRAGEAPLCVATSAEALVWSGGDECEGRGSGELRDRVAWLGDPL